MRHPFSNRRILGERLVEPRRPASAPLAARLAPLALVVVLLSIFTGAAAPAAASGLVGTRAAHAMAMLPPSVATITAARMEGSADSATLAFDVSATVSAATVSAATVSAATVSPTAFVLVDPDRAIIDLPQVDFAMDAAVGRPAAGPKAKGRAAALVSSFRFGLLAPGRSRIVIDLGAPARIASASVRTIEGRSRLVVELVRTDRTAFRAAARAAVSSDRFAGSTPAATSGPAAAGAVTIVLDPGHGGPDTGAIVNGVVEKDIALAFASRLAAKLGATGTFKVVMTRSSDVFIPLSERVRIAREAGAALMVSVHADTLPETGDVGGATVYTVSDKASDAYAAKVAAKENAADATVGVDGQADTADVNDILFDLTRQETRAYSHVFARTLVNYWKVAGRLNKNPQRAAGFVVLKAPDVPSVLLELGYLSNATDAASLTSAEWREQATGRMAEAIGAYFADRQGPAKAQAGVPIPLKQVPSKEMALKQASAEPAR